ncbi:MAG: isoprenylcysteine carboxylmethyltransferase family protein [Candidatus Acidiferrales bacterium]
MEYSWGMALGLAVEYTWVVFAIYWLASAMKVKRSKQRESRAAFWLRTGLLVLIFEFCFSPWGRIGWLGARFLPRTLAVVAIGLAIEILGIALAIWARYCLGANWSGAVTLKEGHTLISAGPYKRIRHPIYTGLALAFAGTAIAVGEWRAVLAFAAIFIAHFIKARKEEAWLEREFGAEFEVHRAHTGMFLPKF